MQSQGTVDLQCSYLISEVSPILCWVLSEERSPYLFHLGTPTLEEERGKGRRVRGKGGRKMDEEVKIGELSVYHYFLTFDEADQKLEPGKAWERG